MLPSSRSRLKAAAAALVLVTAAAFGYLVLDRAFAQPGTPEAQTAAPTPASTLAPPSSAIATPTPPPLVPPTPRATPRATAAPAYHQPAPPPPPLTPEDYEAAERLLQQSTIAQAAIGPGRAEVVDRATWHSSGMREKIGLVFTLRLAQPFTGNLDLLALDYHEGDHPVTLYRSVPYRADVVNLRTVLVFTDIRSGTIARVTPLEADAMTITEDSALNALPHRPSTD